MNKGRDLILNVSCPVALKSAFCMAGINSTVFKNIETLQVVEHNGVTLIFGGDMQVADVMKHIEVKTVKAGPRTILIKNISADKSPLLLNALGLKLNTIKLIKTADRIELARIKETNEPIGFSGMLGEQHIFVIGFELSRYFSNVLHNQSFAGHGNLIHLIKGQISQIVKCNGAGTQSNTSEDKKFLLSCDVESRVDNRSTGRVILQVPFFRGYLSLSYLKIYKPLKGRLLIKSLNIINSERHITKSLRFTFDIRKGIAGCFAENPFPMQIQLNRTQRKKTTDERSDFLDYSNWYSNHLFPCTHFMCPPDKYPEWQLDDVGFHSYKHTHYHMMSQKQICNEVNLYKDSIPSEFDTCMRAPGLLWSKEYFRAVSASKIQVDSSIMETNRNQFIEPFEINGCIEMPVHSNIARLKLEDLKEVLKNNRPLISMYYHDFEMSSLEKQKELIDKLDLIREHGYSVMSIKEWYTRIGKARVTDRVG